ncbi:MAG: LEPR-XLL domain-containing protein, partial [Candidatus Rokubacteria bacterium]|nr:LEPR-XLL domain-containing protein [Candidatus Rokubacteria bacterium]
MSLAELFFSKHPRRDHVRRAVSRCRGGQKSRPVRFEPLEPRLLLSTTPESELLDKLGEELANDTAFVLTVDDPVPTAPEAPVADASDATPSVETALGLETADTSAFPVPLDAVRPDGSLIYDGSAAGTLDAVDETDTFTVNLDAGQKASLMVWGLGPSVQAELLDPGGASLGTTTQVLQMVPIAASGTYTIRVTSLQGTGEYGIWLGLNAAGELEAESLGSNDTLATAESLGATAVALQGTADRLAVLGVADGVDAGGPITGDYFAFALDAGQVASLGLTSLHPELGTARLALDVWDAGGTALAAGVSDVEQVDHAITGFLAPAAGTYYARVTGDAGAEYSLVVTRGAALELGGNVSHATAQDLTGVGQALGSLRVRYATAGAGGTTTPTSLTLFDGQSYEWDIMSDGEVSDGTNDAYDGGLELQVASTWFPGIASADWRAEDGGRELILGPVTAGGLSVTRKIYVPTDQGWARFLEILTNPGTTAVTARVTIDTNLGSDS